MPDYPHSLDYGWLHREHNRYLGDSPILSDIAQSTLWGLGKVISLEHPELTCTRVDLDSQKNLEDRSTKLWAEICAGSVEDQVAYRNGVYGMWHVYLEAVSLKAYELRTPSIHRVRKPCLVR